jgi:hypothetical protein
MPAFFVKNTKKGTGIVVSDKPLASRTIELKNGMKRTLAIQQEAVKFGFFAMEEGNASELGYVKGEKIPVSLTNVQVVGDEGPLDLFWCNPD